MLKYRLNLAISASCLLVQMENSYVTFKTAHVSHAKPSVNLPPVTHSPLSLQVDLDTPPPCSQKLLFIILL